jgi:uncharacterized membrane protein
MSDYNDKNDSVTPEIINDSGQSYTDFSGDTRIISFCCHLANAIVPVTALSGFVSLFVYLFKTDPGSHYIRFHAKQAFIYYVVGYGSAAILGGIGFIFSILTAMLGACIAIPVVALYGLLVWVYSIYVSYKVFTGHNYRIPHIAEWADKLGK